MTHKLRCPACRKIYLNPKTDPETGLEIDVCPGCWGMWFDPNELGKFFESPTLKEKFFLPEEAMPLDAVGYTISSRARLCPRCKQAMSEKEFGGVQIDICLDCQGIWLDEGELQRIVLKYKKGHRDDKNISKELAKGLEGKGEGITLNAIIHGFKSFLGVFK